MGLNLNFVKYAAAAAVGLGVLYTAGVGALSTLSPYYYQTPEDVNESSAEQKKAMVIADAVTAALEGELDTVYGFLPNDLCFVPNILDNRTSYQRGVIYATRPASDMVAKTVARVGERDTIDSRLADATSRYFTYGENVWGFWFVYDCEGKYRQGIKGWKDWAASVGSTGRNAGVYNVKSDDVYSILRYCHNMMEYALGILNDSDIGHFSADNNIYFAKGVAAVAGNVLKGISCVDSSVAGRGGAENLNEALKRFDYIARFDPLYVFAGGNAVGDAMLPNHVAALARHFDICSNRIADMMSSMEK